MTIKRQILHVLSLFKDEPEGIKLQLLTDLVNACYCSSYTRSTISTQAILLVKDKKIDKKNGKYFFKKTNLIYVYFITYVSNSGVSGMGETKHTSIINSVDELYYIKKKLEQTNMLTGIIITNYKLLRTEVNG
ncbi:MAG: hypothetical protein COA63_014295 [Methylophaga sp.]|nr:hypothetical protein [Methylophaga sp.]